MYICTHICINIHTNITWISWCKNIKFVLVPHAHATLYVYSHCYMQVWVYEALKYCTLSMIQDTYTCMNLENIAPSSQVVNLYIFVCIHAWIYIYIYIHAYIGKMAPSIRGGAPYTFVYMRVSMNVYMYTFEKLRRPLEVVNDTYLYLCNSAWMYVHLRNLASTSRHGARCVDHSTAKRHHPDKRHHMLLYIYIYTHAHVAPFFENDCAF